MTVTEPVLHTTAEKLAELRERLELAKEPGGEKAAAKRDKKGIPSARARIYELVDPGSFMEIGALCRTPGDPNALYGDGVVTGHGLINGRPVGVFSHDQTVFGGTVGEMFGRKVARLMEWCAMVGCPIVGINDSGGARIQDAVTSLAWYAELGRRHELLSGLVPQISIILGKCAGERCIRRSRPIWWWRCATRVTCSSPAPTSSRTSPVRTSASTSWGRRPPGELRQHPSGGGVRGRRIPVRAGLSVVSAVQLLRQTAGRQPRAGTRNHRPRSGTRLDRAGLGQHGLRHARGPAADLRRRRLPRRRCPGRAGDHHRLRAGGRADRWCGGQPAHAHVGAIDNEASDKAARFIRFSDAFDIPLVFVVDTPGFLPGVEQEKNGIIKRGGRFLYAVVEADVPKVTITIRKSYGGAYAVMGSKQLTADLNFAWPTARIAVIGADGAAQLLMKRFDLNAPEAQAIRKSFVENYNSTWRSRGSPPSAGSSMPSSTRMRPGCCCASRCTCCGTSSCGGGWAASTA